MDDATLLEMQKLRDKVEDLSNDFAVLQLGLKGKIEEWVNNPENLRQALSSYSDALNNESSTRKNFDTALDKELDQLRAEHRSDYEKLLLRIKNLGGCCFGGFHHEGDNTGDGTDTGTDTDGSSGTDTTVATYTFDATTWTWDSSADLTATHTTTGSTDTVDNNTNNGSANTSTNPNCLCQDCHPEDDGLGGCTDFASFMQLSKRVQVLEEDETAYKRYVELKDMILKIQVNTGDASVVYDFQREIDNAISALESKINKSIAETNDLVRTLQSSLNTLQTTLQTKTSKETILGLIRGEISWEFLTSELQQKINAWIAPLNNEIQARIDGDAAEATARDAAILAAKDEVTALIIQERTAREELSITLQNQVHKATQDLQNFTELSNTDAIGEVELLRNELNDYKATQEVLNNALDTEQDAQDTKITQLENEVATIKSKQLVWDTDEWSVTTEDV